MADFEKTRGTKMAGTRIDKSEPGNLGAEQADREEARRTAEQVEQQDLNQGTDTGTHDTTRRGVDWGRSYRTREGEHDKKSGKPSRSAGSRVRKRRDES